MRNNLIKELEHLALEDRRICLLTGDLGFGVLDHFIKSFPDRFFNMGISEQNMASVAAGLAIEGNIVYTYSIGNFPTLRCIEQIRNDICYNNANVKIIVVGGGFAYGQLGMSHHATEDLAMMRSLPNMRVYSPADSQEAVKVLHDANNYDGPCYIRLGKGGEPDLHPELLEYDIRNAIEIIPAKKIALFATGSILGAAKEAAFKLMDKKIETGLYGFAKIKPLDEKTVIRLADQCDLIFTVEEHNIIGGFGGAVAEVIAGMPGNRARQVRIGLNDMYTSIVGSQEYLRNAYGMSAEKIMETIKKNI